MTYDDQILRLLWPADFHLRGTELYAVLDGARDIRIHRMLGSSEVASRCLYAGVLSQDLREVGPYLVHAQTHAALTRQIIATGWGEAWGIWIVSAAPFDDLYRHLRRFLRVRSGGRPLLFRYYDPVVLDSFLPTCTADELATLFGPIDAFLVERGPARQVVELRFDGVGLRTHVRTPDHGLSA